MTVLVRPIVAPNPGPFTLEGTNTWLVGEAPCFVIDPGPDLPEHVDRVVEEAGEIAAILLTHHHSDHAPAATRLAERTGAPIMAASPNTGEQAVQDRQDLSAGGVRLLAVATPGHSSDHVAFFEPIEAGLFTGDAVLGRGTSVVDPPEGDMAVYIRSLEAMRSLGPRTIYPGHGPVVQRATAKLDEYLDHRRLRERQILAALEDGPRTATDLVPAIYHAYPEGPHAAAARSVLAHLLKLEREGRVARDDPESERFQLLTT